MTYLEVITIFLICCAVLGPILYFLVRHQTKLFKTVKEGDIINYDGKNARVIKKNENSLIIEVEVPWSKIGSIKE
jgi:uncharacterized protein YkvS